MEKRAQDMRSMIDAEDIGWARCPTLCRRSSVRPPRATRPLFLLSYSIIPGTVSRRKGKAIKKIWKLLRIGHGAEWQDKEQV